MTQIDLNQVPTATTADELLKIVLDSRQIPPEEVLEFLNPPHPRDITLASIGISQQQVSKSHSVLRQALQAEEKVVIYGDYDADGVCATALVWRTLSKMYANCTAFIPDRTKHGYGLTVAGVEEVINLHSPKVLITVDNGIVSHEAIKFAQQQNVAVIVTDHHQADEQKSSADALIHTTKLCGTTVAWVWLSQILKLFPETTRTSDALLALQHSLDLCAIATIADMVPLTKWNRSFAKHGLSQLRTTTNLGLLLLFKQSKVAQSNVSAGQISFNIAPLINVAGRMDSAMKALRLLCTGNKSRAQKIAQHLAALNENRRTQTTLGIQAAKQQLKQQTDKNMFIAYCPDIHEGVIGLVAGKIVEEFHQPTLVLTNSNGLIKGSARSIKGCNITQLLRQCEDLLLSVGGHAMAAGLSFEPQHLEEITSRLHQIGEAEIESSTLIKSMRADAIVSASLITVDAAHHLEQLAPYGIGNPTPALALTKLRVDSVTEFGKTKNHLKITLSQDEDRVNAILWNKTRLQFPSQVGELVNVLGTINVQTWKGKQSAQFTIRSIWPSPKK